MPRSKNSSSAVVPASSLNRHVVAVTGGARGIGFAIATELVVHGARVAIGDLDRASVEQSAASLGEGAIGLQLDVADHASFDRFLAAVESQLGPVTVVINNAGIMPIGPWLDESPELAEKILAVNILGVVHGMKLALARMLPRGAGHVINVASMAGKAPVPGAVTYGASKAAVVSLAESARVEFAGTGLFFTTVLPSFTNTELVSGTRGTRFVATVSPRDVAVEVVRAICEPRPDVWVPRSMGAILRGQSLLGRRARDAASRALGADRTFLDVDRDARAAYAARIDAGQTRPALSPAGPTPDED